MLVRSPEGPWRMAALHRRRHSPRARRSVAGNSRGGEIRRSAAFLLAPADRHWLLATGRNAAGLLGTRNRLSAQAGERSGLEYSRRQRAILAGRARGVLLRRRSSRNWEGNSRRCRAGAGHQACEVRHPVPTRTRGAGRANLQDSARYGRGLDQESGPPLPQPHADGRDANIAIPALLWPPGAGVLHALPGLVAARRDSAGLAASLVGLLQSCLAVPLPGRRCGTLDSRCPVVLLAADPKLSATSHQQVRRLEGAELPDRK